MNKEKVAREKMILAFGELLKTLTAKQQQLLHAYDKRNTLYYKLKGGIKENGN